MNLSVTDGQAALAAAQEHQKAMIKAREAAETAKTTASENEANKSQIATEKASAAEAAANAVSSMSLEVNTAQTAYTQALNQLAIAKSSGDEAAIASAESAAERAKATLDELNGKLKELQDAAQKAQTEAAAAQREADTAKTELETAIKVLEDAQKAETEAEEAVKKAEEDLEAAKAEEAKKAEEAGTHSLTEAEAREQGYTIITTAEQLIAIADNMSGKYILMGDIDLSGVAWTPIGDEKNPFTGKLNGNGFSIKNLDVAIDNGTKTQNVGFFGVTDGAEIKDINFVDAKITTPEGYNKGSVGIVAGTAKNTSFDGVSASGEVTGHQRLGGLVGTVADDNTKTNGKHSSFKNCSTNVNVNGSYYAGGLIGYINSTYSNDLVIENCQTSGSIMVKEKCGGGLVGEAGKTIVTINNCLSSANIDCTNKASEEISWLLETAKCGGLIGCANGTYVAMCNSKYEGNIKAEGEFKGEYYGYYMNDAHVTIFELSAGLPADDILNIDGVDGITPIVDADGNARYEITVSTLTGMDKIVAMIRNNPELAEIVTFNVNFDFEAMDAKYDHTFYSQYGVVQKLTEDEDGNVVNDVYIDNEIDLETTFHYRNYQQMQITPGDCDFQIMECDIKPTMVSGLYKDSDGNYYVERNGEMIPTTLEFFFENQRTNVTKRLDEKEVALRNKISEMVVSYQQEMYAALREKYGLAADYIIEKLDEPEYKYLLERREAGEELTPEELIAIDVFELDYEICNIVGEATNNQGCGMGGDASFLEDAKGEPLTDEDGRIRYTTSGGTELRQQMDEEGNLVTDEDGNPVYETLDGEEYNGIDEVYAIKGVAQTDENGNKLYTDSEGKTVVETKDEEGNVSYAYEDGTAYEGETDALKKQIKEYNPSDAYKKVQEEMKRLLEECKNKEV